MPLRNPTRDEVIQELHFAVQYRQKDPSSGFDPWHTMAAFDVEGPAQTYCDKQGNETWEYRMVPIPDAAE